MAIFFSLLFAGIALFIILVLALSRLQVSNPFKKDQAITEPSETFEEPVIEFEVNDAEADGLESSPELEGHSEPALGNTERLSIQDDGAKLDDILDLEHEEEAIDEQMSSIPPLVLFILPKSKTPFQGYDLLQSMLSHGLRYGDMKIFHYNDPKHQSDRVFSIAQATETGSFEINQMGSLVCRGLCVFLQPKGDGHDTRRLDMMLDIAQNLTQALGARLCDDKRRPVDVNTREKLAGSIRKHSEQAREAEVL